jgi:tetratricopeptide (TPR) repeat protein
MVGLEGDLRRAHGLLKQAMHYDERFGEASGLRFLRGEEVWYEYAAGNWEHALRLANQFIAECEAGSPHYQESGVREHRAAIRLARGDDKGALDDLRTALRLGREARDPQAFLPALSVGLRTLLEVGVQDEAEELAEELFGRPDAGSVFSATHLAWSAIALGRQSEAKAAIARVPRKTLWHEAAMAVAEEDFARAAEAFAEMGDLPAEASARVRAAEALIADGQRMGADEQLQRALAFWRSVGATRYIREGEALLAKTA